MVKHVVCADVEQIARCMDDILGKEGEGVMLKDPNSEYECKRSHFLLKVKKFDDAEAKIIGYHEGTGKYKGMMGAIQVREENGIEFKIGGGFDDEERQNPPKLGEIVTFKYQGRMNSGVPRFPIFLRIHPGM